MYAFIFERMTSPQLAYMLSGWTRQSARERRRQQAARDGHDGARRKRQRSLRYSKGAESRCRCFAESMGCASRLSIIGENDRDEAELTRATETLSGEGAHALSAAFDATSSAEVAMGIEHIEDKIVPIDILINNAGIHRRVPLVDMTELPAMEGGA